MNIQIIIILNTKILNLKITVELCNEFAILEFASNPELNLTLDGGLLKLIPKKIFIQVDPYIIDAHKLFEILSI